MTHLNKDEDQPQPKRKNHFNYWAIEHRTQWKPTTYEWIPNPEGYTEQEIAKMIEDATHDLQKAAERLQRLIRFQNYQEQHPTQKEAS